MAARPCDVVEGECEMRCLGRAFFLLVLADAANAAQPSLPFSLESEAEEYLIRFTDQGDHAFPLSQAQQAADAIDRDGNDVPGSPKGYHDGYVDLGFLEPYFNAEKYIDFWDCKEDDDTPCDNGQATTPRIRVPTSVYSSLYPGSWANEMCLRRMLGHELFHHIEFAYVNEAGGAGCGPWGDAPCEGMARMLQDHIYNDLDVTEHSCNSSQGAFDAYLSDTNRTIWDISYTSALFWKYLAEQYGDVAVEPERGADFIVRWWENAVGDYDTPDVVDVTRNTIQDFGGTGMTSAFHDFSIANVAKDFDLSALPANEQARWSYIDSGQGFAQPEYDAAPIFRNQPVSPGDGDAFGGFVAEWGAFTIGFDVDECPNLGRLDVGIDIPGAISNTALMSLLFIRDDQVVDVVKKTGTEWNYSRYVPVAPYDRLVAILATLDAPVIYEIAVNCTTNPPSVDFPLIPRPDPTHGGPPGSFAALDVDVDPRGGTAFPTIDGLKMESDTIEIGPAGSQIVAPLLATLRTPLGYRLIYGPPAGLGSGAHRVAVEVGGVEAAADSNTLFVGERSPNVLVLFDRSQSMATLVGGTSRFEHARRAALATLDGVQDDSRIGLVSFAGDGIEPNDDAVVARALAPATASQRTGFQTALAGLAAPSGPTSIGDALARAAATFETAGAANQERHAVLLSDGAESEAAAWPGVRDTVLASGMHVHAIALGEDADQGLLAEIATETRGSFEYVHEEPAATLPTRLADAFARAADRAENRQRFFEAERQLGVGGSAIMPIEVEEGFDGLRVRLDWDDPSDAVSAVLRDPSGTARASFNPKEIKITGSVPFGTWHLQLGAITGAPRVTIAAAGDSFDGKYLVTGVSHRFGDGPSVGRTGGFASNEPLALQAALVGSDGPILGADATAEVEHPDGTIDTVELRDEGDRGDAAPHDGVYTGVYRRTTAFSATSLSETQPGSRGSYPTTLRVRRDAEAFERIEHTSFWIGQGSIADADGDGMLDRWEARFGCLSTAANDFASDPDGDRSTAGAERLAGTDPCDSDTDDGGENDGSEFARGGAPGDGSDDALPAPGWFATVNRTADPHLPKDPKFTPQPFGILLRVPTSSEWAEVVIERRAHPDFLWEPIGRPTAASVGGAFLDDSLPEGVTYSYRMRGVDADGNESAVSPEVTATVQADPLAPNGALRIDRGPRTDDAVVDVFVDLYTDDPADIEMRLVTPVEPGAAFEPYASVATVVMPTVAEPTPVAIVATLRDDAGNLSLDYSESILQYPPGSLGSIRGIADRIGTGSNAGIIVSIADRPEEAVAVSEADGSFVLDDLLPGIYRVEFVGDGITGRVTGVVVDPSDQTDVGTVLVPEPHAIAAMLVAIAALARRYSRSSPSR